MTVDPNLASNDRQDAILLIEKTHFAIQSATSDITHRMAELLSTGCNDVYFWWNAILSSGLAQDPDLKMTVIFPATEAHITKYSRQERRMITETAEIYKNAVLPWIESQPKSRLMWVHNILQGIKEQENVLFRDDDPDTGFIVLPDSKWDRRTLSSLYLLAISQRDDVRSLRDLTTKHLPMLKNIRDKALALIPERFPGVASDQVRMYVHYHPSYYHFHVHITHISAQVSGSAVGQSHLLDTIIDNIENITPDYYSRASLRFALGVNHPVFELVTGGALQL
ncbi:m7GpppX diphosphatase [Entomortierella parvispora]|uniref:m7GpppX diphosphatase n=1 Tax=Entomortierella parvispora TaxID=205924 RepID=A0A9P3H942_9FUNG|nr:m7GpppX diphosphatase [Entomortierella parvispora]